MWSWVKLDMGTIQATSSEGTALSKRATESDGHDRTACACKVMINTRMPVPFESTVGKNAHNGTAMLMVEA
jgi:hypothetical protein